MRRAIAGGRLARVAAEGDLLPALVTSIGVTAVGRRKIDQLDEARLNADTAQLGRAGFSADFGGRFNAGRER